MNSFAGGAENLVELMWGNVQLPFPTIQFSHNLEAVKIYDYTGRKYLINMNLNSVATSTKLKHLFVSYEFGCILSSPQIFFLLQSSGLCSLTLQVGMK